jgi:hypothetical protein
MPGIRPKCGPYKRKPVEPRFWIKVDRRGPDDCWPWLAAKDGKGYGAFSFNRKRATAHRVAFFFSHGHWPVHDACHKCDNPACCNPAHLFDGTHQDNMDDMVAKRRHQHGERNGHRKLTEVQVLEIRRRYIPRKVTGRALAAELNVSHATVEDVIAGRTWRHLLPTTKGEHSGSLAE